EGVPQSARTDGMVHHLVTVQASDGRWFNQVPRPPMNSSDVTATALAVHALRHYGWPGRQEGFGAGVERGRRVVGRARGEENEEGSGLSAARSALGGRAGGEAGRPGPIAPAKAKAGWRLGATADARK